MTGNNTTHATCRQPVGTIRAVLRAALWLGVLLSLLSACAMPDPAMTRDEAGPTPPQRRVGFRPGDVLEFKFFYTPELNEVQTIRPDGQVSLQLVGEVEAAGKTAGELTAELK
ncbi:polysaccharide biosynthesis/export family protein [Desulfohalovibrio reitneri]|uniref:polysaccharide biosynthesis/export family protein n=1 Tax=Desulfohalovibrio reitneri TaxID=1307759 RepID=UPI00068E486C|nr:polysaccharide biosynthesis/export family protein [Desulfohalovibrio reitneri]